MRLSGYFALRCVLLLGGIGVIANVGGCADAPSTPDKPGATKTQASGALSEKAKKEQRQAILKVRTQTLNQLHKLKPQTQLEIQQAAGYGVFEINGLNAVLVERHGRGMVMERSGKVTYMQLARTDIRPGAQLKPYWQVMIFRDPKQLSQFVMSGSPADVSRDPNITVYQLSDKGVSTQADWGARYFRDPNLN